MRTRSAVSPDASISESMAASWRLGVCIHRRRRWGTVPQCHGVAARRVSRASLVDQVEKAVLDPEGVWRQGDQLRVNVSNDRASRLGLRVVLGHVLVVGA